MDIVKFPDLSAPDKRFFFLNLAIEKHEKDKKLVAGDETFKTFESTILDHNLEYLIRKAKIGIETEIENSTKTKDLK